MRGTNGHHSNGGAKANRHCETAGVLIAGGGVAALEAMLALRHLVDERIDIELMSPGRDFVYQPLAVTEPFGQGKALRFDLHAIAGESGARYRADGLAAVDTGRHRVTTSRGDQISYDALVIACGARKREALPGALTFWGTGDERPYRELLDDAAAGRVRDIAFAVPSGAGWPLPLYELALLTASELHARGIDEVGLTIVTPESAPLEIFGTDASRRVAALLRERGIETLTRCYPHQIEPGRLTLVPAGRVAADRVVSLPRAEGPALPGIPHDVDGFIPVDRHGRVHGVEDVYAAGDVTSFAVKQGGLAAQQADAVAEVIAQRLGAWVEPQPFRPVLRGLLLTGAQPSFLRAEISGGNGETSVAASEPLWWPPGKIAGRYLGPHLATLASTGFAPPGDGDEASRVSAWRRPARPSARTSSGA